MDVRTRNFTLLSAILGAAAVALWMGEADAVDRANARREWNRPVLWPLGLGLAVIVLAIIPAVIGYRRRERWAAK